VFKVFVMQETLMNRLLEYIRENNPDVLFQLEQEAAVTQYLTDKVSTANSLMESLKAAQQPSYFIEELCLTAMTAELRPSRYQYILSVLREEFESEYEQLVNTGLLQTELINMIGYCNSVFEDLNFSEETEDNIFIRYAITGLVQKYLKRNSVIEIESNELQQSAKAQGQY
jgi:Domain of unknown function (DUF1896)